MEDSRLERRKNPRDRPLICSVCARDGPIHQISERYQLEVIEGRGSGIERSIVSVKEPSKRGDGEAGYFSFILRKKSRRRGDAGMHVCRDEELADTIAACSGSMGWSALLHQFIAAIFAWMNSGSHPQGKATHLYSWSAARRGGGKIFIARIHGVVA